MTPYAVTENPFVTIPAAFLLIVVLPFVGFAVWRVRKISRAASSQGIENFDLEGSLFRSFIIARLQTCIVRMYLIDGHLLLYDGRIVTPDVLLQLEQRYRYR